jgi:hypothetical protein
MSDATDLVGVRDAARELGVSTTTLRYRLGRGLIAGRMLAGHMWVIPREEVERLKARPSRHLPKGPRRSLPEEVPA